MSQILSSLIFHVQIQKENIFITYTQVDFKEYLPLRTNVATSLPENTIKKLYHKEKLPRGKFEL